METQPRREDRRTIYTKNVIKDAMLELLAEGPFEKITVAALCRKAEIVRTTFYLHYDGLTDVLKELADDAILAAGEGTGSDLENISRVAAKCGGRATPSSSRPTWTFSRSASVSLTTRNTRSCSRTTWFPPIY